MRTRIEHAVLAGSAAALLAAHAACAVPRLSVGNVRGFPGHTAELPLSIRYLTNDLRNVVALQADVAFAEELATPGPLSGGPALQGHLVKSREPGAGTRRVLVYALNNALLSNGVVATIPFAVTPGSRANVHLTLNNVLLSTAEGISVPVTVTPGAIVITPVYVRPEDSNVEGYMAGLADEKSYVVQATTNFLNWVSIATNTPVDSFLDFMDLDGHLYSRRFYRALPVGGVVSGAMQLSGGNFVFKLAGVAGRAYTIQASTNLLEWVDLSTVTATDGNVSYTNLVGGSRYRFYRLKSGP